MKCWLNTSITTLRITKLKKVNHRHPHMREKRNGWKMRKTYRITKRNYCKRWNLSRILLERELASLEKLTEISVFLSGIFFASILLVFQIKDNLEPASINLLAGPLSISCILFLFLALSCVLSGKGFGSTYFVGLLFSAFSSFFVSLYVILSFLNQTIAVISVILSIILFILYWVAAISDNRAT